MQVSLIGASSIGLPTRLALCWIGLCLAIPQARAELYKCRKSDGQISYQQTACDHGTQGGALAVDTREVDGEGNAGAKSRDYSIESQLQEMRAEREQVLKERESARQRAEFAARETAVSARTDYDPAKCSRQRAEVAKWHQKVLNGYHKRSEKEINENKLAYHEALVDRYCEAKPR